MMISSLVIIEVADNEVDIDKVVNDSVEINGVDSKDIIVNKPEDKQVQG